MGMHTAVSVPVSFKLKLAARGYQILFHADETNRCPGCGHSQWYVGRVTAECAYCGTALAIAESNMAGFDPIGRRAVALHVVDAPAVKGRPEPSKGTGLVIGCPVASLMGCGGSPVTFL